MASANETVLLKSTLEIVNKSYSVKLTSSEIYWEEITSARASGGPYSEPLVRSSSNQDSNDNDCQADRSPLYNQFLDQPTKYEKVFYQVHAGDVTCPPCGLYLDCFGQSTYKYTALHETCECSFKTENQTVKLTDILAVQLGTGAGMGSSNPSPGEAGRFRNLEMVMLSPTAFCLWVVKRAPRHKWRERRITFHSKDISVIQQWVEKVQEILTKPDFARPKSLLVFINPISGRKKAGKLYREKIAPLFDLAGITSEVITTARANHARDTLLDYDLSKVDGVVCLGGDGMFSELVTGVITRKIRDSGMDQPGPDSSLPRPNLRIAVIPAGSTDTVSWTTNGFNDPVTSALHIIVGDSISMDVATVYHGNQFHKYNISMCAYGYYGDCILDSENNRWMGPHRYDWSGFKKVIGSSVYEGEISFRPSTDKENHPQDRTICKAGCQVCHQATPGEGENGGPVAAITADDGWQRIKGRFKAINSFIVSCRCRFSAEGPAPTCHIGDGCLDLVLVHECSRSEYIKHLYRCSNKNADQFDMPFVQVFRVKEFKFRPLVDEIEDTHEASDVKIDGQQRLRSRSMHNSVWNCDGEVIDEPAIDVRVHRQLIRLFARGIEDEVREPPTACIKCSCIGRT